MRLHKRVGPIIHGPCIADHVLKRVCTNACLFQCVPHLLVLFGSPHLRAVRPPRRLPICCRPGSDSRHIMARTVSRYISSRQWVASDHSSGSECARQATPSPSPPRRQQGSARSGYLIFLATVPRMIKCPLLPRCESRPWQCSQGVQTPTLATYCPVYSSGVPGRGVWG